MPLPRISILGLMAIVGLVAVDVAVLRGLIALAGDGSVYYAIIVFLILGNVLLVGLVRLVRQLGRSGECRPFLFGFQAVGWSMFFLLAAAWLPRLELRSGGVVAGDVPWLVPYGNFIFTPINRFGMTSGIVDWLAAHPKYQDVVEYGVDLPITAIVFGVPALTPPLLGGLTAMWLGVTLVRRPRKRREPVDSASDSASSPTGSPSP